MADIVRDREGPLAVFVVDRQGNKIAELADARVDSMSWVLNDIGSCVINVPTEDKSLKQVELVKREIQVWHEDELAWWGVPWRLSGDHETTVIDCDDLMSYFLRRYVTHTSLLYENIDQFTIAWNLISHVQNLAHGNLGFTANYSPSGVPRWRHYRRDDHENILDLLQEFPTLNNGFDFEFKVDGTGLRQWVPHYPHKGVHRPRHVVEWGRNIVSFEHSEDALEIANHVYVTGGQANNVRFEQNFKDDAAAAEYGLMHAIESDGNQLDVAWLLDKAKEEVRARKHPSIYPVITCKNDPVQFWGEVFVGDTVPVKLDHGRIEINRDLRIVSMEWQEGNNIAFEFNEPVEVD